MSKVLPEILQFYIFLRTNLSIVLLQDFWVLCHAQEDFLIQTETYFTTQ